MSSTFPARAAITHRRQHMQQYISMYGLYGFDLDSSQYTRRSLSQYRIRVTASHAPLSRESPARRRAQAQGDTYTLTRQRREGYNLSAEEQKKNTQRSRDGERCEQSVCVRCVGSGGTRARRGWGVSWCAGTLYSVYGYHFTLLCYVLGFRQSRDDGDSHGFASSQFTPQRGFHVPETRFPPCPSGLSRPPRPRRRSRRRSPC